MDLLDILSSSSWTFINNRMSNLHPSVQQNINLFNSFRQQMSNIQFQMNSISHQLLQFGVKLQNFWSSSFNWKIVLQCNFIFKSIVIPLVYNLWGVCWVEGLMALIWIINCILEHFYRSQILFIFWSNLSWFKPILCILTVMTGRASVSCIINLTTQI